MIGSGIQIHTEYLERAKKLRDTAAQVQDQRVVEALISSAESYERMARWLGDDRRASAGAV